jgi:hypothetical protein
MRSTLQRQVHMEYLQIVDRYFQPHQITGHKENQSSGGQFSGKSRARETKQSPGRLVDVRVD